VKGSDDEAARLTREVTARAIRRLDYLEWLIFAGAALLAMIGGALIALLLAGPLGLAFRATWLISSALLFVIPGLIALIVLRRSDAGADGHPPAPPPERPEDG